jgi:glycosyltransferase involved in cell wall biosynthesis
MAVNPAPIAVLFLTDMLPVGGAETQLVALVNALDPDRVRPRVVILRDHAEFAPQLRVPQQILKMAGPLDVRVIHRLRAIIVEHEIRAIHTTHVRSTLLARALRTFVRPAAPQRRLAIITTEHSYRQPTATPILDRARRWTAALSDRIVAVSNAQAEWLRSILSISGERIVVIPNAIDPTWWAALPPSGPVRAQLGIRAEEPVFVCVARLVPVKDHATLLAAMETTPGHLILVGDGSERRRLEDRARREPLAGRVHFVGEHSDPRPYLAEAWAVCLASTDESQGISLLEGMAAGLPAVATRVGGIPEIVEDGVTGLLVPSRDPRAFAAALARVAGDAGWRGRAAAAARRAAVERGTIDGRARRIETMIEGLVAGLAS